MFHSLSLPASLIPDAKQNKKSGHQKLNVHSQKDMNWNGKYLTITTLKPIIYIPTSCIIMGS
jgi:hypothetical protein